jgi:hypothetical protein
MVTDVSSVRYRNTAAGGCVKWKEPGIGCLLLYASRQDYLEEIVRYPSATEIGTGSTACGVVGPPPMRVAHDIALRGVQF